ncbi:hypothetical protein ACOMHN_052706 [Nucella lapillus]
MNATRLERLKHHDRVKEAWVKNGKLYVSLDDGKRVLHIQKDETDIDKFLKRDGGKGEGGGDRRQSLPDKQTDLIGRGRGMRDSRNGNPFSPQAWQDFHRPPTSLGRGGSRSSAGLGLPSRPFSGRPWGSSATFHAGEATPSSASPKTRPPSQGLSTTPFTPRGGGPVWVGGGTGSPRLGVATRSTPKEPFAFTGWTSVDFSASSRHKSSARASGTVHPAQQAHPESAGLGASTAGSLCSPDAAPGPQRASLDDAATTRVPSPPSQVGTLHEGVSPRGGTQSTVAAVSCHPPYPDGTTGACGARSGRVATTTGTSFCVSAESSCGPTRSPEAVSTGPTRDPGVVSTGPTRLLGAGSMGPTCSSAESTCPGQSSESESTGSTQWSEDVSVGPTRATVPTRLLGAGSMGPTCSSAESTCPGQSSEAESTGSTQWSEAVSGGPTRSSEAFSAGPNLSAGDPLAQGALPTDTTFKVSAPQIGDDNSQVTPPSDPAHGGSAGSADSASGFAIHTVDTPGGSTLCAENPSRRGSAQSTDIAPWLAVSDTAPLEECTMADDLAT